MKTKFIFISGGVISGVGKGVTTASIAAILSARGFTVEPIKCDAYLNVDAGTIRPQEHGEVFVTASGLETDQDLGNYERFLGKDLSPDNYITNGMVYQYLIQKERNFEFEGEDVEIAVHVPEELIRRFELVALKTDADFVLIEIGGTVGEYQNILFIEANRILKYRQQKQVGHVHVGYLPTPPSVGEMKSKPVQNSVRQLVSSGIQPDFVVGRAESEMDDRRKSTLAWVCNLRPEHIFSAPNAKSIYDVPAMLERQGLGDRILELFGMPKVVPDFSKWDEFSVNRVKAENSPALKIAVVGKYFSTGDFKLSDAYISVLEAVKHAGWARTRNVDLSWVSSDEIENDGVGLLKDYQAVIVPGGFGSRGVEGILQAIQYARENKLPYLGLCYGMQLACIEIARNLLKLPNANTTEIDPHTDTPIVHVMPDQAKKLLARDYGASMRLGDWDCKILVGSKLSKLYSEVGRLKENGIIVERHRHRYEINNEYKPKLEGVGVVFSGTSPDGNLAEALELSDHPYFVASQFHPEFLSRPLSPHPMFLGLIDAILKQ